MNDYMIYLIIIPVAFILLVFVLIAALSRDKNKMPESGIFQVEVISKRIGRSYSSKAAVAGISGLSHFEYYLKFRSDDGRMVELQCTDEIFNRVKEREKGLLTYEGNKFISFDTSGRNFVYGEQ